MKLSAGTSTLSAFSSHWFVMADGSHTNRTPGAANAYASLRSEAAPYDVADARTDGPSGNRSELQAEQNRLRALRNALWSAFEAGPDAGLPNALIDLTMAYTASLRLQLNLRALAAPREGAANSARSTPPPSGTDKLR